MHRFVITFQKAPSAIVTDNESAFYLALIFMWGRVRNVIYQAGDVLDASIYTLVAVLANAVIAKPRFAFPWSMMSL